MKFLSFFIQVTQYLNTLSIKNHTIHQKAVSWRAFFLSKSFSTVNNKSIFSTMWSEFSTKWLVLLHFPSPYLFMPIHFPSKIPSFTSVNFRFPIFSKNHPYNPHQHSLSLYFIHFSPACFYIQSSLQFPPNFSPYRSVNSGCIKGPLNNCFLTLMAETVTSLTVPQAWIRIVMFTVINSLFLRLIKLVYCM